MHQIVSFIAAGVLTYADCYWLGEYWVALAESSLREQVVARYPVRVGGWRFSDELESGIVEAVQELAGSQDACLNRPFAMFSCDVVHCCR
jgi:hypothetical protein